MNEILKQIYENSPALPKLGTIEDYDNYINSVYPNSKVKDVLFRGVTTESDKRGGNQTVIDLTFFTNSEKAANEYAKLSAKKYNSQPLTIAAIVNAENPLIVDSVLSIGPKLNMMYGIKEKGIDISRTDELLKLDDFMKDFKTAEMMGITIEDFAKEKNFDVSKFSDEEINFIKKKSYHSLDLTEILYNLGYDSVIVKKSKDWFDFDYNQIGVKDENYLSLGKSTDILGFMNFMKGKKLQTEVFHMRSLMKKIY